MKRLVTPQKAEKKWLNPLFIFSVWVFFVVIDPYMRTVKYFSAISAVLLSLILGIEELWHYGDVVVACFLVCFVFLCCVFTSSCYFVCSFFLPLLFILLFLLHYHPHLYIHRCIFFSKASVIMPDASQSQAWVKMKRFDVGDLELDTLLPVWNGWLLLALECLFPSRNACSVVSSFSLLK